VVELIERLIGKGYEMVLFDRNVNLARLVGANREYINRHIPHIARLMVGSIDEVLAKADTIVIGNGDPAFGTIIEQLRPQQRVVDLVRAITPPAGFEGYEGICW
jgi:GDP-mannose 6-dehydrogenase